MADLIRYDLLVQEALRGVVRQVLTEVAKNGLQGEHHFFITFKTATPGLRLSNRMRERYPDEMTIILQHQFWGLSVADGGFEVGLSFHNTPEKLFVPFAAITMFQDPSVNFGLKFDVREALSDIMPPPVSEEAAKPVSPSRSLAPVPAAKPSPARVGGERPTKLTEVKSSEGKNSDGKAPDAKSKPTAVTKPKAVLTKVAEADPEAENDDKGGTKVVSIDAFRKKP